jgi:hypothetical protein
MVFQQLLYPDIWSETVSLPIGNEQHFSAISNSDEAAPKQFHTDLNFSAPGCKDGRN